MSEVRNADNAPLTEDHYLVEVEWDVPGLPRLVGPFSTRTEAEDWGALNIPNGTWNVAPLAWPYYRIPPVQDGPR